jgi:4-hydroxy-tetrahydrodipicolinate reductase
MAEQRTASGVVAVGVVGVGGRMGRALIDGIAAAPDLVLAGGVERPGHPACGTDLPGGLVVCANVAPVAHKADVLVDFSSAAALPETLRAGVDAGVAIVVGTTGLGPPEQAALDRAARDVAVLASANMSLGVNLLAALVELATARLGPDWDVEIAELHHRGKVDAPSGTALMLGEAAARGRGAGLPVLRLPPHDGVGEPRGMGGIGFASLRGGTAAGDHLVLLLGEGERLTLGHVAEDRAIFARGALVAARWLSGRGPGRYTMADVLGTTPVP